MLLTFECMGGLNFSVTRYNADEDFIHQMPQCELLVRALRTLTENGHYFCVELFPSTRQARSQVFIFWLSITVPSYFHYRSLFVQLIMLFDSGNNLFSMLDVLNRQQPAKYAWCFKYAMFYMILHFYIAFGIYVLCASFTFHIMFQNDLLTRLNIYVQHMLTWGWKGISIRRSMYA